jgi:hypothetical protein
MMLLVCSFSYVFFLRLAFFFAPFQRSMHSAFGWVFLVSTFFFGDGFRCLLRVVRCLVPCLVPCVQIQPRAGFDGVSWKTDQALPLDSSLLSVLFSSLVCWNG